MQSKTSIPHDKVTLAIRFFVYNHWLDFCYSLLNASWRFLDLYRQLYNLGSSFSRRYLALVVQSRVLYKRRCCSFETAGKGTQTIGHWKKILNFRWSFDSLFPPRSSMCSNPEKNCHKIEELRLWFKDGKRSTRLYWDHVFLHNNCDSGDCHTKVSKNLK